MLALLRYFPVLCLLFLLPLGAVAAAAPIERIIEVGDGVEVPVSVFPASGDSLMLWLPSETGLVAAERQAAASLSQQGIEVWLADTLFARFLPILASSLEKVPAEDVAKLIEVAHRETGKSVYLVVAGRGAVPALQGAAQWGRQHAQHRDGLAGAVLIHPNLYVATPEPGEDVDYRPVATQTRLDVIVLQGELSPLYWRLDALQEKLKLGGSRVIVKTLKGTRDRFYAREATSVPLPSEDAMAARLPELVYDAWRELSDREGVK